MDVTFCYWSARCAWRMRLASWLFQRARWNRLSQLQRTKSISHWVRASGREISRHVMRESSWRVSRHLFCIHHYLQARLTLSSQPTFRNDQSTASLRFGQSSNSPTLPSFVELIDQLLQGTNSPLSFSVACYIWITNTYRTLRLTDSPRNTTFFRRTTAQMYWGI